MSNTKNGTQLYALLKKASRHYNQRWYNVDDNGKPAHFEVEIPTVNSQHNGQAKGGPGGNYYIDELNFYVKVDGNFVRI